MEITKDYPIRTALSCFPIDELMNGAFPLYQLDAGDDASYIESKRVVTSSGVRKIIVPLEPIPKNELEDLAWSLLLHVAKQSREYQKDMLIDGKRVNLSPGMNITAEIKTGHRRVIEYLLSPVQRAGRESLRER